MAGGRTDYRLLLERVIPVHLLEPPLREMVAEALERGEASRLWSAASTALETLAARGHFRKEGPTPEGSTIFHQSRGLGKIVLEPPEHPKPTATFPLRPLLSPEHTDREKRDAFESILTGEASISSQGDQGDTFRRIEDYLHKTLGPVRVRFLSSPGEEPRGGLWERWEDSPLARRFTDHFLGGGDPLYFPDLAAEPLLERIASGESVRSVAALPLRAEGKTLGMIEVHHPEIDPFGEKELGILSVVAVFAAGRIRRAREMERLVYIDPLTGVFSRRFFEEQALREVERANRESVPLALVMVDLDNFKEVNDRFGHPAGDSILARVARLLQENVRRIDLVTRFGGEEFAILLPGATREQSEAICERLRSLMEGLPVPEDREGSFHLTTSIGVALYPDQVERGLDLTATRKELLAKADAALYRAKRSGKNQVLFWSEE